MILLVFCKQTPFQFATIETLRFNATLTAKVIKYHGSQRQTNVSWLSHTSSNTTFFPKLYFSYMLQR